MDKRDLLARLILAQDSVKRRQNIHQVGDAYRRANALLEKADSLMVERVENGEWHGQFMMMLAAHGFYKELTFNEMEELSDRAAFLHGLCKKVSSEN